MCLNPCPVFVDHYSIRGDKDLRTLFIHSARAEYLLAKEPGLYSIRMT
ncbi:hypothetical protein BIT89_004708, partial [Salmonella enterica subsp. enterica serovar Glostrup]|nr:hypothetical protein [Salmonella enterica subsp. enterica serovar Glostrup]